MRRSDGIEVLNYAILLALVYVTIVRIAQFFGLFSLFSNPANEHWLIYVGFAVATFFILLNLVLIVFVYKKVKWAYWVTAGLYFIVFDLLIDWKENLLNFDIQVLFTVILNLILTLGALGMIFSLPSKKKKKSKNR